MNTLQIDVWSDFMCPFCYVAERRLGRILDSLHCRDKVRIVKHSYELAPDLGASEPVLSCYTRKYDLTLEQLREFVARLVQDAAPDGADFSGYERAYAANTFTAHRLAKYAESMGQDVWQSFYLAHFRDGLDLADTATLVELGLQVGLKKDAIEGVLAGDAFADAVQADERRAASYGVEMVPYFRMGEVCSFEGSLPYVNLENHLKNSLALACIDLPEIPKGATCGPNGCTLG